MNNISSINSVNTAYLPVFKQNGTVSPATNPITYNDVPMRGMDALASYNMGNIQSRRDEPKYITKTLDEHLFSLQSRGKREGIDYILEANGPDRFWLTLKDKFGNVSDRIEYIDGKFEGCDINTYKNGKLVKQIGRNNNRIESVTKMYYADEYPQETFSKHRITCQTTPEEFTEYLKNNNIKFRTEYEGADENNRFVSLIEYGKNDKPVREYLWYYGENNFDEDFSFVSVSKLNKNNEEVSRTTFNKDRTEVCDYKSLSKSKTYDNSDYDISKLTEAGITYETTEEEYIKYLDDRGINYQVKKYPNISAGMEIDEFDADGNTVARTEWIYEPNSNNLERIYRSEESDFGKKRFDFYPDVTETVTSRYMD